MNQMQRIGVLSGVIFLLVGCDRYVKRVKTWYHEACPCKTVQNTVYTHVWRDEYDKGTTVAHVDIAWSSESASLFPGKQGLGSEAELYSVWYVLWAPYGSPGALIIKNEDGSNRADWHVFVRCGAQEVPLTLLSRLAEIQPGTKQLFEKRYTSFRDIYEVFVPYPVYKMVRANASECALVFRSTTHEFCVQLVDPDVATVPQN